jgi:predicted enzyme related to lactoylglutathione lyase
MFKTFAILALVGNVMLLACSCTTENSTKKNTSEVRGAHMPVSEHAIYYLEIVTANAQSVSEFYASAYGWRFEPQAPELGNALVAILPDGSMCGIRAPMHEQEEPIVRTYLRVANIDAALKRASQLGATVALEPMEIPGRGKVAIYFIGGIEQGLWQFP